MQPTTLTALAVALGLCAACAWGAAAQQRAFVHPGIGNTLDELLEMRKAIVWTPGPNARKTWYSSQVAWAKTYRMRGPFLNISRNPNINYTPFVNDARAIAALARAWFVEQNATLAERALAMLRAYAGTHRFWSGAECPWLPMVGVEAVEGAEILRATYPGYTPQTHELLRRYFATVWTQYIPVGRSNPYGRLGSPGEVAVEGCGAGSHLWGGNQAMIEVLGAMNIAVFTDSWLLFNETLNALLTDATGGIPDTLPSGQVGDTGRDTGHAALQMGFFVDTAKIAWIQGVNLFSSHGSRIRSIMEFLAQRQLHGLNASSAPEVTFVPFGSGYAMWSALPPFDGVVRYLDEIATAHAVYTHLGLSMPFSKKLLDRMAVVNGFATAPSLSVSIPQRYVPEADFVEPPTLPVSKLSFANIGAFSASGSARQISANAWSLSTGGLTTGAESMRGLVYAYTEVTGDFTLTAKIASGCGQVLMMDRIVPNGLSRPSFHARMAVEPGVVSALWGGGCDSYATVRRIFSDNVTLQAPMWVKLVRRGNFVYPSFSLDSVVWSPTANILFPAALPDRLLVGISVYTGAGVFTDVRLGNRANSRPRSPTPTAKSVRGSRAVTVSWPAVANALFYDVLRSDTAGGIYHRVATQVLGCSFQDTGVNKAYYYKVTASGYSGVSPASGAVRVV
eukprot:m51a1_g5836 hypothetical protein (677) ;mRNA; r:286599-288629